MFVCQYICSFVHYENIVVMHVIITDREISFHPLRVIILSKILSSKTSLHRNIITFFLCNLFWMTCQNIFPCYLAGVSETMFLFDLIKEK